MSFSSPFTNILLSVCLSCREFWQQKIMLSQKKAQISPDRNTISQEELEQMLGEFDLRSNVNIIFYQFKKGN